MTLKAHVSPCEADLIVCCLPCHRAFRNRSSIFTPLYVAASFRFKCYDERCSCSMCILLAVLVHAIRR